MTAAYAAEIQARISYKVTTFMTCPTVLISFCVNWVALHIKGLRPNKYRRLRIRSRAILRL